MNLSKVIFPASFIVTVAVTFQACDRRAEPVQPNIILIMSDDMGYSDIGCYGGEIRTPTLDSLAAGGIRFTQFYNTARCCPTRASLLTGLYPHQAGMGWMTGIETDLAPYQGDLGNNAATIAEVVGTAGYETFMTGKWHVSKNIRDEGPRHNWPLQRGFDRFYGTITGAGSYYDPATLCRGNTLITPFVDSLYPSDNYYYTDAIADEAARFIRERDRDRPFFLYMAFTAAHWPMHAKPEDIEKYRGMYDEGWEKVREQRFMRMKELGVIPANTRLSSLDVHPWEEEEHQEVKAQRMEIYAAMVDAMDQGIGRVVQTLRDEEIFDHTMVIFLQDNGGCAEEIGTRGEVSNWAAGPEELVPLTFGEPDYHVIPRVTREGKPIIKGEVVAGGPETTYVAYGKVWANASNTPFREYKHWVHEGGISTPLIMHYPAKIREGNDICSVPGHVIDLLPTIAELAEARYPDSLNGNYIHPQEGISLLPVLEGKQPERDGPIFWEHEMNRAVRLGDWKLVSRGELLNGPYGKWKNYRLGRWELYNLAEDRSELNDLASAYPEKVEEMASMWDEYAARTGVFPAPWEPVSGK